MLNSAGRVPRSAEVSVSYYDPRFAPLAPTNINVGEHKQPTGLKYSKNQQALNLFSKVDTDNNGAITVKELGQALVNGDWSHFDWDTIKMLMDTFDVDRNGILSLDEFVGLWAYIRDWHDIFVRFDHDQSGFIDGQELSQALHQFGYDLPVALIRKVGHKYAAAPVDEKNGPDRISFDRFIRACTAVKKLSNTFRSLDQDKSGSVQMNYEQFMDVYFSLP